MRGLALGSLTLLLTACNSLPIVPKIVRVPVETIVPVPAELSADCDLVAKRSDTVGEGMRLANARLESLKKCNQDKAKIRALTP